MKTKNYILFYILIGSAFLITTAPALFTEGMTMDGVLYASISRNLANGVGSFWNPCLTQGLFPNFYEHPPLALGLQSLWFKAFGDSIYVERFYSLSTYVILAIIIVAIWKQLTDNYRTGWIPLLFFFSMLKISWACASNMLENTMSVFIGLSILFYLKSLKPQNVYFVILSGLFLFAAVLTKGLVGLYAWGFPLFYWLFNREIKFTTMALNTLLLVTATLLPLVFIFLFWPEASTFLLKYFNHQILGSIQNTITVNNRFFIVTAVIYHAIPPITIGIFTTVVSIYKKINLNYALTHLRMALPFLLLAIAGILPITISLKQSGHYAITTYPYIALAISLTIAPLIEKIANSITLTPIQNKLLAYFAYTIAVFAIAFSFMQTGKLKYDKEIVSDCHIIIDEIGKDQSINICPEMYTEWNLHGYFARYGNISLITNPKPTQTYLILDENCLKTNITEDYKEIPLNTTRYKLFQRK